MRKGLLVVLLVIVIGLSACALRETGKGSGPGLGGGAGDGTGPGLGGGAGDGSGPGDGSNRVVEPVLDIPDDPAPIADPVLEIPDTSAEGGTGLNSDTETLTCGDRSIKVSKCHIDDLDPESCENAWKPAADGPISCYWGDNNKFKGERCSACGPNNRESGMCTNECAT